MEYSRRKSFNTQRERSYIDIYEAHTTNKRLSIILDHTSPQFNFKSGPNTRKKKCLLNQIILFKIHY
jgi:hypothetical protein